MKPNVGNFDRAIRITVGIVLLVLGSFSMVGGTQIITLLIGGVALVTGVTGFCGLYKVLGVCNADSCKIPHHTTSTPEHKIKKVRVVKRSIKKVRSKTRRK